MTRRTQQNLHSTLTRRRLLQASLVGTGALLSYGLSPSVRANRVNIPGLAGDTPARESVDVTQLCDPKVNTPGERKINHWAKDPQQAGNISYAPVAFNERLFTSFGADTLVRSMVSMRRPIHMTRESSITSPAPTVRPSLVFRLFMPQPSRQTPRFHT